MAHTDPELVEHEKQSLEEALRASDFSTLRARVAYILNAYPAARDSDITLQLRYWETFEPDVLTGLTPSKLYHATRLTSLARARAKIQNEYKLFQASHEVRRYRRSREDRVQEQVVGDAPPIPRLTTYCDESGKNARWLIVGGVWSAQSTDFGHIWSAVVQWRESHARLPREFHFSELARRDLDTYKSFLRLCVDAAPAVGFKAIIADRASATLTEEAALLDAYSLYVVHGLRHERKTGRATAAITLDVFPDEESELRDKVLKARVREVVAHALVTGGLGEPVTLGAVEPIESRSQVPLQLADLFIGAINRLHNPTRDHVQGPKDDFASYICELLGLTWDGSRLRSSGDRAMIKYL